jgi:hypothetical protein
MRQPYGALERHPEHVVFAYRPVGQTRIRFFERRPTLRMKLIRKEGRTVDPLRHNHHRFVA